MSLDRLFIGSIVAGGSDALGTVTTSGISDRHFYDEDAKNAYHWICDFHQKYGQLPSLASLHGHTGVEFSIPTEPYIFFLNELRVRHAFELFKTGVSSAVKYASSESPVAAMEYFIATADRIRGELQTSVVITDADELADPSADYAVSLTRGAKGIQTPWKSMNDACNGFWPEDLILVAGRAGTGKTWCALMLAHAAWKAGKKVLFLTTEVSQLRISLRLIALDRKLTYSYITSGSMDPETILANVKAYKAETDGKRFQIIGGCFDYRMESLAKAVDFAKPDFVIVDGVYLLKVSGSSRQERMSNAFDDLKRMAKTKKVPILLTTQFNRDVKRNSPDTVGDESIAMSDVGIWNADIAYGLIQTQDMKNELSMMFKCLKTREGVGKDFSARWDFQKMDFHELQSDGGGGGDADEKGLPVPGSPTDDAPF